MFVTTNKEELLKSLEQHRKNICLYMSPNYCDCKYGGPGDKYDEDDRRNRGEQSGCPELRTVMEIIRALSEEQIEELLASRGHVGI